MFLNYSKTHNPGLLLPHYLYWFDSSFWSPRSGVLQKIGFWTFIFLREHLPRTGFRLEDFGFLDYLEYWILSSRVLCKFRLSGFFINFSFLDYLGYWILSSQVFYKFCLPGFFISDSWIIWDIGFRLPGLFGILVCGVGLL
ncbi:unnamed protein product [Rhizophagus irregularis]|nr:unnamed protein product [Rhizophagus irregularis]